MLEPRQSSHGPNETCPYQIGTGTPDYGSRRIGRVSAGSGWFLEGKVVDDVRLTGPSQLVTRGRGRSPVEVSEDETEAGLVWQRTKDNGQAELWTAGDWGGRLLEGLAGGCGSRA